MKRSFWRVLVLCSLLGCAATGEDALERIPRLAGASQVFTLTNLHPDDRHSRLSAVNYQQDGLIPICSVVEILSLSDDRMKFRVDETWTEYVYVYHRAAREPFERHLARYFGPSCPQDQLDALSEEELRHVKAGDVAPGMSRLAVVLAIGYPPLRSTPSLEAPQWRYWRSRFRTMLVVFGVDERVLEIRQRK